MTAAWLPAAMAHAALCQPLEACGVLSGDEFIPVANLFDKPNWFTMDMRGYCRIAKARKIDAIVHSHVHLPPIAGEADRSMCEQTGLPWVIISWPTGRYCIIEPTGERESLVGREWEWGVNDCFSLAREGFRYYTGIDVPQFDREWEFWAKGIDLIGSQADDAGFIKLPLGTPPQHCDVFGMQVKSDIVNHLALFLHPDQILHQLLGRLSVRELYDGTLQGLTKLHLRHKRFAVGDQAC